MALPPFRGPGFGGGPPPTRLPPFPRQPSSGAPSNALQSPSFGRTPSGAFPFGPAGVAMSPPAQAANAHGVTPGPPPPEANLDISDFPALGSGTSSSVAAPNLLSSYASQAGTGVPPPTPTSTSLSSNGPMPTGIPTAAVSLAGLSTREFSVDDFPALGGFGGPGGEMGIPGAMNGQVNDMSLLPGGPGSVNGRIAGEQASAVAALQLQQQQRANLLGGMNGANGQAQLAAQARAVPGGQGFMAEADKRAFPQKQNSTGASAAPGHQPWVSTPNGPPPTSLPLQNGNSTPSSAPSPLPPSSANPPPSLEQQQSHLRSPSMPAPTPPTGSSNPPGVLPIQQRDRRAGAAVGSGPPPPSAVSALSPHPNSNSLPPSTSSSNQPPAPAPQTPVQQVLFSPADRYGLLGLLHIIKTTDPDLSMLALGSDLTTLGLDLGATENLYSTFITPWSDSKAAVALNIEPEFHLPSCYNVQPPPAGTKIGNFSDETLFFIFYSQPRDAMQEMAAHELYKHNWRYHKDLRLWLTKEAGTEPTQKTQSYERGSYIFFDPTLWERVRKDFVLVFDSLERRQL